VRVGKFNTMHDSWNTERMIWSEDKRDGNEETHEAHTDSTWLNTFFFFFSFEAAYGLFRHAPCQHVPHLHWSQNLAPSRKVEIAEALWKKGGDGRDTRKPYSSCRWVPFHHRTGLREEMGPLKRPTTMSASHLNGGRRHRARVTWLERQLDRRGDSENHLA
jgi:hypothetical protein